MLYRKLNLTDILRLHKKNIVRLTLNSLVYSCTISVMRQSARRCLYIEATVQQWCRDAKPHTTRTLTGSEINRR